MNRFRPLVDAVQSAAFAAHGTGPNSPQTRLLATTEAQLAAALPATHPKIDTYIMRWASVQYAEHLAALGQMGQQRCSCSGYCGTREVVNRHRQTILTLGLTPGNPVVEVGFSRSSGSVTVTQLFVRGCGGPYSGNYLGGGADGDTSARSGHLTDRTTDQVEQLLLRQGWRVVTFDQAAQALTAAGFHLGGGCTLDRFHALRPGETGDGRWRVTHPDCDEWTLHAVAVRDPKP